MTKEEIDLLAYELANLRLKADLTLAPQYPAFSDKPYPLGRCLEIRDEMYKLIHAQLAHNSESLAPLAHYMQSAQKELQKVWGSLRDEYFQNAIVVGHWYIDCANDTVNANKPRVEIKKLEQSGFSAIKDFEQFVKIAQSYWQVTVYQNTAFPALAPYFPLICENEKGASWLAAANDDMLKVAMNSEFALSQRILANLPPPPKAMQVRWRQIISKMPNPDELLTHQGDPLSFCKSYSESNLATDLTFRDKAVRAFMSLPKGA
ncbi:hypothetical protein PSECIP111951_00045 [Pseudoalteromonas holothuriae]|uniref:Uncharacterized protein n=1 Tax=Pseudoalteromonas holothuriae TaxID=2963714 RepID=A0A9W4QTV1_9GAMM|nr:MULTISPECIES: hypothetical protein [unclassified Pseudoalteromonas]CAH9049824.1 hypothetical protein PSECIP111951_00045 [Pseudoalteromonas sp. CIP111951]CAH9052956.1 hypothetical protein PSECIP111854_01075 [Pseudoalteromonas sp. CIP111854]